MLADIGLIGAIYTFIRLLQSITVPKHPIIVVITVVGLLAIGLLAADIVYISADLGATIP